jgi:hypothetical protein
MFPFVSVKFSNISRSRWEEEEEQTLTIFLALENVLPDSKDQDKLYTLILSIPEIRTWIGSVNFLLAFGGSLTIF